MYAILELLGRVMQSSCNKQSVVCSASVLVGIASMYDPSTCPYWLSKILQDCIMRFCRFFVDVLMHSTLFQSCYCCVAFFPMSCGHCWSSQWWSETCIISALSSNFCFAKVQLYFPLHADFLSSLLRHWWLWGWIKYFANVNIDHLFWRGSVNWVAVVKVQTLSLSLSWHYGKEKACKWVLMQHPSLF